MTKLVVVALVAVASFASPAARAEAISVDAGASYLAFDDASTPALAIALAAGTALRHNLHFSMRGHLAIGDGHTTSLGPHVRHDIGTFFIGYGLAIANVVGPDAPQRAHGLGVTGELRLGAGFGPLAFAAHARRTCVFASDSHQTRVDGAFELGAMLGLRR